MAVSMNQLGNVIWYLDMEKVENLLTETYSIVDFMLVKTHDNFNWVTQDTVG